MCTYTHVSEAVHGVEQSWWWVWREIREIALNFHLYSCCGPSKCYRQACCQIPENEYQPWGSSVEVGIDQNHFHMEQKLSRHQLKAIVEKACGWRKQNGRFPFLPKLPIFYKNETQQLLHHYPHDDQMSLFFWGVCLFLPYYFHRPLILKFQPFMRKRVLHWLRLLNTCKIPNF